MSQISAADVKNLRDITGAGMMDCKKALDETGGDMQQAIDFLRKKGAALAAKRADREAHEGMIQVKLANDCKRGVLLELNCETDFVARGNDFTSFTAALSELALSQCVASAEAMLPLALGAAYDGETVDSAMKTMTGKLGEKINLKRLAFFDMPDGVVEGYIHPGAKLGAIVSLKTDKPELVGELAKDLAMQIAAAAPIVVDRSGVPADYIAKEAEIYRQQALEQGKKEEFVDKIVTGRLEKYYQDVVLTEQVFIKDDKLKVSAMLDQFRKKNQATLDVVGFVRYQLGE
uniref:Elongation factor Ts n=1 Tax=Chlorobium chlorochromatii (strain CaD3) TaxID=340177 RepID=EFTS_CHLCH|nr:RecName: Full=Elongation factor Ts; Short=EF-Ts [Chlorobium chlorochromatii CaD3]